MTLTSRPPPPYVEVDPNKHTGDPADGRGSARDCYVDPALPIRKGSEVGNVVPHFLPPPAVQYSTYLGTDWEGYRFNVLNQWLTQLDDNLTESMKARTRVLTIPVSGGKAQRLLMNHASNPGKLEFYTQTDPRVRGEYQFLVDQHDTNLALVKWVENWYRWANTTMGSTAPGEVLDDLYHVVRRDMERLAATGDLTFTNYDIYYVGDGHVRPQKKDFADVLAVYGQCATCQSDFSQCGGVCSQLVTEMNKAWGDSAANSQEALEFRWALLQGMPKYYGGGSLNLNFVQLQPERVATVRPNEVNSFTDLVSRFEKRGSHISLWEVREPKAPVSVVSALQDVKTYKLTHLFMYNLNARVDGDSKFRIDSDGDGVFDEDEVAQGTNPTLQRSNGICLDSIYLNPAFHDRCVALESSHPCDPTLDSDADDLNECEEQILGTDDADFDTDGDAIPDSLEWIYGLNAHQSDKGEDSNGDGVPNFVQFAAGIMPKVDFGLIPDLLKMQYTVDFMGTDVIRNPVYNNVRVDLYNVQLFNVPTAETRAVSTAAQGDTYRLRASSLGGAAPVRREPQMRLLSYNTVAQRNTVVALARMIDPNEPQVAYWRLLRMAVPVGRLSGASQVDLSSFRQLDSTDRNEDRGLNQ